MEWDETSHALCVAGVGNKGARKEQAQYQQRDSKLVFWLSFVCLAGLSNNQSLGTVKERLKANKS